MPTQPIFTTGLYFEKLFGIEENFVEKCHIIASENSSVSVSNRGGVQTPCFYPSCLPSLEKKIYEHAHYFCNDLGLKERKLNIGEMWLNINNKTNWNFPHNHLGSGAIISGVFYVTSPQNSGNIVFLNPDSCFNAIFNEATGDIFTSYNSSRWSVSPQKNKLLLFPSSLMHLVEPGENNEERISISFNIYFKDM